jgi:multiple antibiotic resistance protein
VIPIAYVFTILFLALGPLKPIAAFYKLTRQTDIKYRLRVAVLATLISAAIIALVALFGAGTIQSWHVSTAALEIAIGILLLRSTFSTLSSLEQTMKHAGDHVESEGSNPVSAAALAFSPIAIPTIITPTGVVTVVLFLSLAQGNYELRNQIYAVLVLMLALNLAGMLFAGFIIRFVGLATLAVVGWVFAALQAALAVDVSLTGLKLAGFVPH